MSKSQFLGILCVVPLMLTSLTFSSDLPQKGDVRCTKCHASIVESYRTTPMGNASGPATDNTVTGEFHHDKSRVNYKIEAMDGKLWLEFDRPGDPAIHGRRELLYYIGQGRRGRTYLFAEDGFLYESPVNWYADRKLWDMAPAYGNAREIPMNLPALPSCLECHTSGFRPPIKGTENRYELPVFTGSGVSCERCHGPAEEHLRSGGAIVNPAKLAPPRRDDVCMQCHLEGDAAIEREGRHLYDYRPGDDLAKFIRYYVLADSSGSALRASSQFEALAQSGCKKKSGEKMWCGSCHDPHRSVAPEDRVAYYRAKCLTCHGASFGEKHHVDKPDCTSCHMPAGLSKDVAHTQVTDHRILKRPTQPSALQSTGAPQLVPFPYSKEADEDARDKALAWQSLSGSALPSAQNNAERLLGKLSKTSSDPLVLSAAGYMDQKHGNTSRAKQLYERALNLDPTLVETEYNLGLLDAKSGDLNATVKLWEDAFQHAPARSVIGLNLAILFCDAGQHEDSRQFLKRVLQFNPDMDAARRLLGNLDTPRVKCSP